MLSRVADRIFWMSRQMERAENTARILGVTSNLVLFGTEDVQDQNMLAPLSITGTEETYFERHDKLTLPAVVEFFLARRRGQGKPPPYNPTAPQTRVPVESK